MSPKQSKHYLSEILEKENKYIQKRIWSKYEIWKSNHTPTVLTTFGERRTYVLHVDF
ncbi:MAG: hypothetical protein AOA65_1974 [Candidatus Bathyarchaeota archaeon BA1]|nr:MAG: hypothetical protein AOA65_1974 [Candidatus Bathyarchaeota archaeon BA1]